MASLRERIECVGCLSTLYPPLMQCRGGHSHCSECSSNDECDRCQVSLSGGLVRNEVLELECKNLSFECRYVEEGCQERFSWSQLVDHEPKCAYRPYLCPLCTKWKGRDVAKHLVVDHKLTPVSCPYRTPLDWALDVGSESKEGRRWSILLMCPLEGKDKKCFLVKAEQDITDSDNQLGDLSFQITSLNEGDFIGALKFDGPEYRGAWAWKVPSLRAKNQRVILPKDAIKRLPISKDNHKILKIVLSLQPLTT